MLKLEYKPYTLDFKFEARTSRGVMRNHNILILKIYDKDKPEIYGLGEVAPLPGLSEEKLSDTESCLHLVSNRISAHELPLSMGGCLDLASKLCPEHYSSVIFGLETALLDLLSNGSKRLFDGPFAAGKSRIPINGLIWMSDKGSMIRQAGEKIESGFKCIKMKVGAVDFSEELEVLKSIRDASADLIIRLDANGAFKNNEALKRLHMLSDYDIHSIEQPILPRQLEAMQLICSKSPIDIALDEELVGVTDKSEKVEMLRFLKPAYIILKPTLHGGLSACMDWITIAREMKVGFWITSALESNVGLNVIAQFAEYVKADGYQGLGTGKLYSNNIASPLEIISGGLMSNPESQWNISGLF